MPYYDYKCDVCDTIDEILCKYEDPSERECAHCCAGTQLRQASAPGTFILIGDGFYKPSGPDAN